MNAEALEIEVERAWVSLANHYGKRTLFLTSTGKLRWGWVTDRSHELHEVGTYTRSAKLEHLREDVFFTYETAKGRVCA